MKEKEIQKQIEELQEQLSLLESENLEKEKDLAILKLEDISTEDKVIFFDKMFKSALNELKELEEEGYHNEDYPHYAWENFITILTKDKKLFWNYWNSLFK
jgi:biopolymer transport protein ExbB/TolQ